MPESRPTGDGSRDPGLQLAIEAVCSEVSAAIRSAHTEEPARGLVSPSEHDLGTSLAEFGVDSLMWMSILTRLEGRFDTLFPDDLTTGHEAYTIAGLSRALLACLGADRGHPPSQNQPSLPRDREGNRR